jgi:hypothetical protein
MCRERSTAGDGFPGGPQRLQGAGSNVLRGTETVLRRARVRRLKKLMEVECSSNHPLAAEPIKRSRLRSDSLVTSLLACEIAVRPLLRL